MLKVSDLPTNPDDAFQVLLNEIQVLAESFPNSALNAKIKADAVATLRMLIAVKSRVSNPQDYGDLLDSIMGTLAGGSPRQSIPLLGSLESLFVANSLENHLVDAKQEDLLNTINWEENDRGDVLKALGEARKFVSYSPCFDDAHKSRVLFWISRAENEVFKPQGKWDRFRGAMSEVADMAKEFGEKAQPLADLIKTARTTTKKNITEVRQIEADAKPKQIEGPQKQISRPSDEEINGS